MADYTRYLAIEPDAAIAHTRAIDVHPYYGEQAKQKGLQALTDLDAKMTTLENLQYVRQVCFALRAKSTILCPHMWRISTT